MLNTGSYECYIVNMQFYVLVLGFNTIYFVMQFTPNNQISSSNNPKHFKANEHHHVHKYAIGTIDRIKLHPNFVINILLWALNIKTCNIILINKRLFVAFTQAVNGLKAQETPKQEQNCIKKHKNVELQDTNTLAKGSDGDAINKRLHVLIPRAHTALQSWHEQEEPHSTPWLMASGPSNEVMFVHDMAILQWKRWYQPKLKNSRL